MLNILNEDPTWGPLWENAGPNDLPFDDLFCLVAEYDARVIGAWLKGSALINQININEFISSIKKKGSRLD